jgi:nucleoside-triphosphatase THEP1
VTGNKFLADEIGAKSLEIARLMNEVEQLKQALQRVLAVLTAKQREKLGFGDS